MRRQKRLNPVVVALLVDPISDRHRFLGHLKPLMEASGEAVQERSGRARRVLWRSGIVSASRATWLGRLADGTDTVALLNTWIEEALELGASVGDPPRQEPFGAEAWLLDPEGNRLLLLVLP